MEQECAWCERGLAVLGLVIGVAVAYIAVDTLLDGALTKGLARSVRPLAPVLDFPTPEEPPAS